MLKWQDSKEVGDLEDLVEEGVYPVAQRIILTGKQSIPLGEGFLTPFPGYG